MDNIEFARACGEAFRQAADMHPESRDAQSVACLGVRSELALRARDKRVLLRTRNGQLVLNLDNVAVTLYAMRDGDDEESVRRAAAGIADAYIRSCARYRARLSDSVFPGEEDEA